jgi:hypothetical protein
LLLRHNHAFVLVNAEIFLHFVGIDGIVQFADIAEIFVGGIHLVGDKNGENGMLKFVRNGFQGYLKFGWASLCELFGLIFASKY